MKEPLKVKIYINNKPIEEYSTEELEDIKMRLTYKAMRAAGYVPKDEKPFERYKKEYGY